jgi:hypothetical protein
MAIKLSEFTKVSYKVRGRIVELPYLYQSIKNDRIKGIKYLARFNYEGAIKTKIIGYSKKDNLTKVEW